MERKRLVKSSASKIAGYFLYAAMIQGAAAVVITFLGAFADQIHLLPVPAARVIAAGEAGTWFTVGYVIYLIVGVVAMAVTSLFYFYIETMQGKPYKGISKAFAWMHLILGNIGVAGAAFIVMWGGYWGGAAMQPTKFGGKGWDTAQVHVNILGALAVPIAAFIALALIGFLLGGLGYIIAMRSDA
jgi:heme/copper-type cytochrome/quinol oxidase subunit 1